MTSASAQCSGRHVCSRSLLPHVPLHGVTGGEFVAARAEAYPLAWCREIVQCFAVGVLARQAARLQRYFTCFGEEALSQNVG
eukprot:3285141-Amphidinium_carterae.1